MGGAFTAIEDDACAISYNPGAFSLFSDRRRARFTLMLNPVLPLVSLHQTKYFFDNRNEGAKSIFGSLEYLIKFVGVSYDMLNLGIVFNEERFMRKGGGAFFDGDGFIDNKYTAAVASIQLSNQVSIGVSGSLISSSENAERENGSEFSYGILIRPNSWYQVGITYCNLSDNAYNSRKRFDRIADESLNAGVAFIPARDVILSFDARNLTETDKPNNFGLQEIHLGFEVARLRHYAFRGGFYREKISGGRYSYLYSMGFGLIDLNRLKALENRFDHKTPIIQYTLVLEDTPYDLFRWHMLTFMFRI